jgi:hypothetical protein
MHLLEAGSYTGTDNVHILNIFNFQVLQIPCQFPVSIAVSIASTAIDNKADKQKTALAHASRYSALITDLTPPIVAFNDSETCFVAKE